MIEKNAVIIDLVDYNKLLIESVNSKFKDERIEALEAENRKLKIEKLTVWLKRNFAEVKNNGNDFVWKYGHQKNDYYEITNSYNVSLEVAEIALNEYLESQKGEEE